jgi:hypothetical protein
MEMHPQEHAVIPSYETVASAAIAAAIIIGLLWGLMELSRSHGASAKTLALAEHACANLPYARQREACIKQWLHTEGPTD